MSKPIESKAEAVAVVLSVLRSRLAIVSKPTADRAAAAAAEYKVTAADLLAEAARQAWSA